MRLIPAMLAVCTLACTSTLLHAADITFHKTLTASGTVNLNVCNNSGLIHVAGVAGNSVQISANVHKNNWHSMASTDDMKNVAANPPIHQTGSAIQVGNNNTCGANVLHNIDIDYEISVPKDATLVVKSVSGTIHVDSITGFVHAGTGSGDIFINGIGTNSWLATSSGNLDIQGAHGTLLAKIGAGNLNIHDSDVTDALLELGSGNITATNLKGGVRAITGKGDITMAGSPTAEWELRTSNGAIHFQSDPNAKFELDAEAGAGTIDSTLPSPLSGHITSGVLRGPVRGGGPDVRIFTGNGNITLQ